MSYTSRSKSVKPMIDCFEKLCRTRSSWSVWTDFINATACAIANSTEKNKEVFERREKEYKDCIERLGGVEDTSFMFAMVVMLLTKTQSKTSSERYL